MKALKGIYIFLFLVAASSCIDPYYPKLGEGTSLLVVDGLITDSNNSYTVKLSRTFQDQNTRPAMIADATVYITDNIENINYLKSNGKGIYKTDSLEFKGVPGRTYVIHIKADGADYESEPCLMENVPEIDSIYYEKDEELVNNETQSQQGIRIYLDTKAGNKNQFFRWAFEETWKFRVPYPKKYNFDMADNSFTKVSDVKEFCWKNRKSGDILIYGNYSGLSLPVKKKPLFFIASDQSDRLLIQYSILVYQYSISKKEYDFWDNLKKINESGEDIFVKQPFTIVSNIKNINNPKERVLGYFQVSAVKQKRKFITSNELFGLYLPNFRSSCERIVKNPGDFPTGPAEPPTTWADVYRIFCVKSTYYFVEPLYANGIASIYNLSNMVFAMPECADCEVTGYSKKPDFWIDF